MKEQEVIKRLNFHKEYARLSSNRVVISETDLETVLNILKQNSAELAEKSAEIEKYKSLYNKALEDLVKAEKKNMQKDKQRDLMLKYINYLSDELVQATGRNELEFCNGNRCCKDSDYSCEQCIKQYFERKVKNDNRI